MSMDIAPAVAKQAKNTATTMTVLGLTALLIGLSFILFVGLDTVAAFYWFTAIIVIGITTMLLAPVVYWGKMASH